MYTRILFLVITPKLKESYYKIYTCIYFLLSSMTSTKYVKFIEIGSASLKRIIIVKQISIYNIYDVTIKIKIYKFNLFFNILNLH